MKLYQLKDELAYLEHALASVEDHLDRLHFDTPQRRKLEKQVEEMTKKKLELEEQIEELTR